MIRAACDGVTRKTARRLLAEAIAEYRKSPHLILTTGELALIPAGTVHTFANRGPRPPGSSS
jgi:hypothetical protein